MRIKFHLSIKFRVLYLWFTQKSRLRACLSRVAESAHVQFKMFVTLARQHCIHRPGVSSGAYPSAT